HTDFIFSVIGEELGLLGTLTVITLFAIWLSRVFTIAWKSQDLFSSYLALGIGILFGLQVVFNIGVVMGLLPTKGLALPFLSYGGTALIISMTCVGLLLNISSRIEA
ncbi:MAG: FtsW/RodA/SpoVE family cell cycle protein, partial [Deltaproteobacteria bacterium]|nr:FtsW/RodA/SpoVE family cell cycle protein [Deltaproteobacteria bacterium]